MKWKWNFLFKQTTYLASCSGSLSHSKTRRSFSVPVRAAFRASQATLGVRFNYKGRPSSGRTCSNSRSSTRKPRAWEKWRTKERERECVWVSEEKKRKSARMWKREGKTFHSEWNGTKMLWRENNKAENAHTRFFLSSFRGFSLLERPAAPSLLSSPSRFFLLFLSFFLSFFLFFSFPPSALLPYLLWT